MPTRRLSTMTIAPASTNSSATTSSTQRVAMSPRAPTSGPAIRRPLLGGEEAGFLHQPVMDRLGLLHPVGKLLADHERRVERGVLGVLLPFGELAYFLEDVDVVIDLFLRDARRHEDAAQHRVLDVEAGRLARRDVLPRLRRRHLVRIRHRLRVEYAQRAQRA